MSPAALTLVEARITWITWSMLSRNPHTSLSSGCICDEIWLRSLSHQLVWVDAIFVISQHWQCFNALAQSLCSSKVWWTDTLAPSVLSHIENLELSMTSARLGLLLLNVSMALTNRMTMRSGDTMTHSQSTIQTRSYLGGVAVAVPLLSDRHCISSLSNVTKTR